MEHKNVNGVDSGEPTTPITCDDPATPVAAQEEPAAPPVTPEGAALSAVSPEKTAPLTPAAGEAARMSFVEHLDEFRSRLIFSLIAFAVSTIACLYFVEFFVQFILRLAEDYVLIAITPTEVIVEYMKIALIMGGLLSLPVIVYQLWGFISPGMKKKERQAIFWALFIGIFFFVIGALFAYGLMLPLTLIFLRTVDSTQTIRPMISIASFISFVLSTMLTFGIVFEMPIVVVILAQLGILETQWLVKNRKVAIIVIFIIAAIITPPDILSQIMIGIPMVLLYEISVFACRIIVGRKRTKKEAVSNT